jgi:hypothetical protein
VVSYPLVMVFLWVSGDMFRSIFKQPYGLRGTRTGTFLSLWSSRLVKVEHGWTMEAFELLLDACIILS